MELVATLAVAVVLAVLVITQRQQRVAADARFVALERRVAEDRAAEEERRARDRATAEERRRTEQLLAAEQRAGELRELAATMGERLAEQREQGLHGAVESLVKVASERLGAESAQQREVLGGAASRIDTRLAEMRADLDKVTSLVHTVETTRARQHGELSEQIAEASRRTGELTETTQALAGALSSRTARGQWGERMAEDVLKLAGFVEGVQYVRQRRTDDGGVPDFTFSLPSGLHLHMDVKFPLDNYLRYREAASDPERHGHLKAFLRDTRARVRELADRGYLEAEDSVDCVVLFIPNEQLYAFVQEHDPEVLDLALSRKIVLCSPLTLFAVLAVVRQAAEHFRLERTSSEILRLLGGFELQWEKFTAELGKLGTHIERTNKSYEAVTGTRKRQLERQLDKIEALRAEREATEEAGDAAEVPTLRALTG